MSKQSYSFIITVKFYTIQSKKKHINNDSCINPCPAE